MLRCQHLTTDARAQSARAVARVRHAGDQSTKNNWTKTQLSVHINTLESIAVFDGLIYRGLEKLRYFVNNW